MLDLPHPITALVPGIPATAPQGGTFPSRFLEEGTEAPRSSTTCTRGHPVEGQPELGAPIPLRETEAQGGPPGRVGAPLVPLAFELLHDLQETIVSGRVAAEADLHLVQVGEGVLHLRGGGRVQLGRGPRRRGRERGSRREGDGPGIRGAEVGSRGSGAARRGGRGPGGARWGAPACGGWTTGVSQRGLAHHSRAPAASRGPQSPSDPSGRRSAPGPRGRRRRRRQRAPCWKSEPRPAPPPPEARPRMRWPRP